MKTFALCLTVVLLGCGYALAAPEEEAPAKPDTALTAMKAEMTALRAELAAMRTEMHLLKSRVPDSSATLEARELRIVGEQGKTVLQLSASASGGGRIEVLSKSGKRAALLFARSDDDGELALYDDQARLRANIGGNDDGGYANFYGRNDVLAAYVGGDSAKDSGYIGIYGKDKQEIVGLYGNPKGGVISARNLENKKQVVMIGAAPNNGMGFVGLGTDAGKPAMALFVTEHGGQIKTLNAQGQAAAFLGVSAKPAGNGLCYICTKDGRRIYECGTTDTSGGYVSMHNGQGKRVLFMGASSGEAPDDGVLEVARSNGKLGVVLRGYAGGSSVRVYDLNENVKQNLR